MSTLSVVGLDLAKNYFQLHGNDERGKCTLRKKLRRPQLLPFVANLPACTIVMEACSGASYWAKKFKGYGHQVKLIAPQHVKPFVKGNKNDAADAAAIAEAAVRPSMKFVPVKGERQLDLQAMHRVRERLVKGRTALCNEIRGLLNERGVVFAQTIEALKKGLPIFLGSESEVSPAAKEIILDLHSELHELEERILLVEEKLQCFAKQDETCRRLQTIRGIGLITSTAIVAATPDPFIFKNGRQFAAFLGLVPKHAGTGGKNRLMSISKRGDRYLRSLLVHGARSVIRVADKKNDSYSRWLLALKERRGYKKAAVAAANKNARIVLALLKSGKEYEVKLASKLQIAA